MVKIFGLRLPKTVQHGSFDGLVSPMIEMDEVLAQAIIPLLDALLILYQHFLQLGRRVKRVDSRDGVCIRMMTVPAVGPISALTFKAAIDDPSRSKRTVVAHFGLPPRRYQFGEHYNPAGISTAADQDVRATLYVATNALLMRTKGCRRAVVAVARKLAVLLPRIWADGTKDRPTEVECTA